MRNKLAEMIKARIDNKTWCVSELAEYLIANGVVVPRKAVTKMTYNDVIKALECCIKSECSKCPLKRSFCSENVAMEYALALINRQKAEIERLKSYKNLYEDFKAEHLETIKAIKGCKAEAIKEFVNLFYDECLEDALIDGDLTILVNRRDFENLVREMTEERK